MNPVRVVRNSRLGAVLVAGVALGAGIGGGAVYAISGSATTNTITACRSNSTGVLSIPSSGLCSTSQAEVQWNVRGPRGPHGLPGPGGVNGLQEFTSSGTFTVPSGITHVLVSAAGGGGGGVPACPPGSLTGGDNPGGAGGWVEGTLAVTPGDTYNVLVGTGGSGGTYPSGSPSAGTASQFVAPGPTVLASAGGGGAAPLENCSATDTGAVSGTPGSAILPGGNEFVGGAGTHQASSIAGVGAGGSPGADLPPSSGSPGGPGDVVIQW